MTKPLFLRRPIVGLVICYCLGTWLGLRLPSPAWQPAAAALLLLALETLLRSRHGWILFVATLLTAYASASTFPPDPLAAFPDGTRLQLRGVVNADPAPGRYAQATNGSLRIPFRVEAICADSNAWVVARGVTATSWFGAGQRRHSPKYGDRWEIAGTVKRGINPATAAADSPGAGARTRLFVGGRRQFISAGHGSALFAMCIEQRKKAAECLSIGISDFPETMALLRSLLLGYTEISQQVYWMFQTTGTLHIFAVSGLHVVMLSMPIVFILTMFRISRVRWALFLAPPVILYTIATGAQASAVRACIMSLVFFSAPMLRRKADAFSSLALAAFIILAWAPDQLLNIGFILSFAVVAGLIMFYPVFMVPLRRLWAPDPLAPDPDTVESRPVDKLKGLLRVLAGHVGALVATSCASWLTSLPLMAYFFGRVSIIALVSNLIVIPVSFLCMLAGCFSLVLGSFSSLFADIFNHANVALVWTMVGLTKLMADIPFGAFEVVRPPLWWVFAWYAVLAVAALHWRTKSLSENLLAP